jgi:Family of unknown function (DUF6496)
MASELSSRHPDQDAQRGFEPGRPFAKHAQQVRAARSRAWRISLASMQKPSAILNIELPYRATSCGRFSRGGRHEPMRSSVEGKMAKKSKSQKQTVSRVMHEFKHGELKIRGTGSKVKSRRQAVAIALRESGASNQETSAGNKGNLRRAKAKERRGDTGEARREGKTAQTRTLRTATASRATGGKTKAALYAEAKRRNISGRSRMSKVELTKALR